MRSGPLRRCVTSYHPERRSGPKSTSRSPRSPPSSLSHPSQVSNDTSIPRAVRRLQPVFSANIPRSVGNRAGGEGGQRSRVRLSEMRPRRVLSSLRSAGLRPAQVRRESSRQAASTSGCRARPFLVRVTVTARRSVVDVLSSDQAGSLETGQSPAHRARFDAGPGGELGGHSAVAGPEHGEHHLLAGVNAERAEQFAGQLPVGARHPDDRPAQFRGGGQRTTPIFCEHAYHIVSRLINSGRSCDQL